MTRKSFSGIAAVVTACVLSSPAFAEKEPLRLSPSSKWQLDYADDSCRLIRQFGEGETKVDLIIDRFEPGDSFELVVAGKPFKKVRARDDAKIRFGPAEDEQEKLYFKADLGETPALVLASSLRIAKETKEEEAARDELKEKDDGGLFEPSPIDPQREVAADHLYIDAPGASPVILDTGSLGAPFAAMRKCTDELLRHWNIDVAAHQALTRKTTPKTSPSRWVVPDDYPTELMKRGAQGIVHFRLDVGSDGKPTACHIQKATNPQGFNDAVCGALMKRAKFRPALVADGEPIPSYYVNAVRFQIG